MAFLSPTSAFLLVYLKVTYAQWFAYMFAIREEQFRGRIARYFQNETGQTIRRRSDVVVDYFGAIRLIRNDFVHNKGVCYESPNTRVFQWGFAKGEPLEISRLDDEFFGGEITSLRHHYARGPCAVDVAVPVDGPPQVVTTAVDVAMMVLSWEMLI